MQKPFYARLSARDNTLSWVAFQQQAGVPVLLPDSPQEYGVQTRKNKITCQTKQ
ncbi:MAG: hypothetical protein K0U68_16365 [Gammaproteobacteria bacterium]|nr:hypothetical protein [Gammaproteobacteria bacterium]